MKFAVETWAPEYGIATDEAQMDDSSAETNVDIEVAADKWAPVAPEPSDRPSTIVFVDGIRRIDARVWITDGPAVRQGVCATVAAGAVLCTPSEASVVDSQIRRGLFASAIGGADDIDVTIGGRAYTYNYFPCAGDAPEDLDLGIHEQMTKLETSLQIIEECDLVVFDGPLRGRNDRKGVGYVKTQHVQYLSEEQQATVAQLETGERTPLFLLSARGFSRFTWYLRLPTERAHAWSGIVRCEIPGSGSIPDAVERADEVTTLLPAYASEPHKDGRAPQNLYPIAGLENDLRRRLGDQYLMERALRMAAQ